MSRLTVGLAWLVILSGCNVGRSPGIVERADSAGIEIVTARAFSGALPAWEVAASPEVEIGLVEGEPAYLFYRIRGVVRLTDGRIVVADGGSQELRYFASDGTHLQSAGSEGDGPGEFRDLYAIVHAGADTVGAYDFAKRRVSLFAPDGQFVRSLVLESAGGGTWLSGFLADGALLTSASVDMPRPEGIAVYPNLFRLIIYEHAGAISDTLGSFAGGMLYQTEERRAPLPFGIGGRLGYGIHQGDVFVGASWDREVKRFTSVGRLTQIIRPNASARRLDRDSLRMQYETDLTGLDPVERQSAEQRMERALETIPFPDTLPDFDRFMVARDGLLWFRRWHWPVQGPAPWIILSAEGDPMATVRVPTDIEVREIGADYILGVVEDDLDVERVRLYRFQREG